MIEIGTSTVMFLLGLIIGVLLAAPKFREALDTLPKQVSNYILLGSALFLSGVVAGWIGISAVVVAFVLYIVFGLRDSRRPDVFSDIMNRLKNEKPVPWDDEPLSPDDRAASDDDLVVSLVTDWDASDEGDGATSQGIRELAVERNVIVPPGALDRLVEAGRLQKLESGRYRVVGFSDENTVE